jgi:RNA polymerase sigma-70 factor (ECF subfamily)
MDLATCHLASGQAGVLSPERQARLAAGVREGGASVEEELVTLFEPRVLRMMLARTRDREVARDLAQETLIAVVLALRNGQLREAERLAAFVHGIARNIVNNFFRTRGPRTEPIAPEHAVADPGEALESAERIRKVRAALAGLEPIDRRILLCTLVEGMKPGEIARRLGLGSELVRSRKSRAIKRVVEHLNCQPGARPSGQRRLDLSRAAATPCGALLT